MRIYICETWTPVYSVHMLKLPKAKFNDRKENTTINIYFLYCIYKSNKPKWLSL